MNATKAEWQMIHKPCEHFYLILSQVEAKRVFISQVSDHAAPKFTVYTYSLGASSAFEQGLIKVRDYEAGLRAHWQSRRHWKTVIEFLPADSLIWIALQPLAVENNVAICHPFVMGWSIYEN